MYHAAADQMIRWIIETHCTATYFDILTFESTPKTRLDWK
jgi:hypothetical protein